jgi:hypothetical protein
VSTFDDSPEPTGGGLELAGELYAKAGTPCATCSCSFMTLKAGAGTAAGFAMGPGLTLRVCRIGREPLVSADGATESLWCDDYSGFSELVPLSADDLSAMLAECSRGFVGDLAQGVRPMPRELADLRWYDRGLREGWLPPHRIEASGRGRGERLTGPWEQFQVVGVTPAFGDGHTPAIGSAVLQAKDRSSYLLPDSVDDEQVSGEVHPHTWWVNQVSAGAALPLEAPIQAHRGGVMLVRRGGERVLRTHAYRYCTRATAEGELDTIAADSLRQAEAARARGDEVVARLCARRGLKARPQHPALRALAGGG